MQSKNRYIYCIDWNRSYQNPSIYYTHWYVIYGLIHIYCIDWYRRYQNHVDHTWNLLESKRRYQDPSKSNLITVQIDIEGTRIMQIIHGAFQNQSKKVLESQYIYYTHWYVICRLVNIYCIDWCRRYQNPSMRNLLESCRSAQKILESNPR